MNGNNRLYPVFLYRDCEAALDWLTGTVGFELRMRTPESGPLEHAELSLGGAMIMLGPVRDEAFGRLAGAPDPRGNQGGRALYVAVEDPDALFARVVESGAPVEEEPTDRPYGSREFTCRDTEGNLWCFGTYHPAQG